MDDILLLLGICSSPQECLLILGRWSAGSACVSTMECNLICMKAMPLNPWLFSGTLTVCYPSNILVYFPDSDYLNLHYVNFLFTPLFHIRKISELESFLTIKCSHP